MSIWITPTRPNAIQPNYDHISSGHNENTTNSYLSPRRLPTNCADDRKKAAHDTILLWLWPSTSTTISTTATADQEHHSGREFRNTRQIDDGIGSWLSRRGSAVITP
ncbi:hypothetical protein AND_010051 [Anopheles darlingi]|uniref:Uncharacterized protein n=1 Tax=Anopheles darlingi TaxID=43151 RepID=W5J6G5_ANODA|nr:hypothetical protein AND_010051 [Anopheles darlingi]